MSNPNNCQIADLLDEQGLARIVGHLEELRRAEERGPEYRDAEYRLSETIWDLGLGDTFVAPDGTCVKLRTHVDWWFRPGKEVEAREWLDKYGVSTKGRTRRAVGRAVKALVRKLLRCGEVLPDILFQVSFRPVVRLEPVRD